MDTSTRRAPDMAQVEPDRLYEVTAAAADFYARQLSGHQPALAYLRSRGIGDLATPDSLWQLGYAPAMWRGLLNHLAGRGFSVEEIHAAGLATYGRRGQLLDRFRDRLVFPVADRSGRIAGFTARDLSGHDGAPKWLNTPETSIYAKSRLLYGLGTQLQHPPVGDSAPLVFVVEGAADVLAVWQMSRSVSGLPGAIPIYAVAPCGTALTADQVHLLRETLPAGTRLAVAFDGDPAGRHGLLRAYRLLRTWHGPTYAVTLPAGYDPAQLTAEHGPAAGLGELAKRLASAARTAVALTLDHLLDTGRLTRPRDWVEDRLLAYRAIADYFVDDPADLPALAETAGKRLGLHPGEVVRGVIEHAIPGDVDNLASPELTTTPPANLVLDPWRPPLVTWAHASQRNRWPVTDATNAATDRATGRWAWALAHGIGDRPETATAADTAARVAAQTAARATPAAGIAAAGAALNANPAAGGGDAAITVATAHPSPDGMLVSLAWSGNVRAYTLVDGQVIQVTTDHTLARQRHDACQPVTADSQLHHLLTSSARHGPVDRTSIVLPPGGRLLLCTANANLDPAGLRQALSRVADPQAAVDRLLHRTGGANATVMLLHTPAGSTTALNGQPARLARLASVAPSAGHAVNDSPPAADTIQLIGHLRSLLAGEEQRTAHTGARR